MSALERIGIGRTAEVFAYDDGRILKLLRPGFPEQMVEEEAEVARIVDLAGLAAPHFFGTVTLDGRPGLVYERIHGRVMLDQLTSRPWRSDHLAKQFVALHASMHDTAAAGLPAAKDGYRHAIGRATGLLGTQRAASALERIDALQDGSSLCHGDMHPGNVMMAGSGPAVIDWMSARSGPVEADIARTLFLLSGSNVPGTYPRIQRAVIGGVRRRFASVYLTAYRRHRPVDIEELEAWRLPILAARLAEGIEAENDMLLTRIDADLAIER